MLAKRIIPCLDVHNGAVVKGTRFKQLRFAGNPVELAAFYSNEGADELVFLDISATIEARSTMVNTVREIAAVIFIPFTVGGGIRSLADVERLLESGADKVSINTAAVRQPHLIEQAAKKFGSQCIVVAVDAKKTEEKNWQIYVEAGKTPTGLDAIQWCKQAERLGAGEILLTSIDRDGTTSGYDCQLTRQVTELVTIPVIASGGAGSLMDLLSVITEGKASAVLLASLVHFRQMSISEAKKFLAEHNIPVRL
ncbi:MAG: imidazole glycerol phosphate synthase subunit HisF [Candidatus Omnitrophica bacterium]|nr:imidazole glycerol phosphate synthase subunit HisF [Candidatus Omnitrophota bacterium]